MARAGGVFCVEGQWDDDLTRQGSVLPLLELLERLGRIRFIHRDTATPDELHHYLDTWLTRRYSTFKVGFFAMHGNPSQLCLSGKQTVELDEVAGWMSGRCEGKKLYFGACSILRAPNGDLRDFLHETGATMLCGYTKQIDWIESAALETLVLDTLVNGGRVDSLERLMRSARWQALADHLGFRVIYAT
ncbi:hypothetical protein AB0M54_43845 [Actinoplanes sp. NPDC051470]|uniref:DUF6642 family protein n=1 Tax=unclassified Actinoplanes TaxID=2626549 RepID=UPI00343805A9